MKPEKSMIDILNSYGTIEFTETCCELKITLETLSSSFKIYTRADPSSTPVEQMYHVIRQKVLRKVREIEAEQETE